MKYLLALLLLTSCKYPDKWHGNYLGENQSVLIEAKVASLTGWLDVSVEGVTFDPAQVVSSLNSEEPINYISGDIALVFINPKVVSQSHFKTDIVTDMVLMMVYGDTVIMGTIYWQQQITTFQGIKTGWEYGESYKEQFFSAFEE